METGLYQVEVDGNGFVPSLIPWERVKYRVGLYGIGFVPVDTVASWVYATRQITSRRIRYSEFIPLALTFTQFTISQLLPSAVSQLLIL
jgi:hypothetical protein